ncbi:hypothetical protein K227x_07240 [Rubripirellula lacrimiformis]|uniref:Transporter n=1 Tax=Rubripirellula lacrimiformis TaxID=1930273 RepID=A0A517N5N7_9BACT|nr:hypothetical protein [Rubripirellula lacrimiformis]QDT02348.1 hypothetical protein K227x_07240 [Rubripirellula lacrimiformis]
MRYLSWIAIIAVGLLSSTSASAQSTISDDPFELTFGKAFWGALLPEYKVGTDANGGNAFQDDGDTLGAMWELKAVQRFLWTRTSFETRAFYGLANANSNANPIDVDVANPLTGANSALSGGNSHLDADVDHYGFDFALRDTWRTRFGGLSAGCSFNYMAFDQDFNVEYGGNRLFREELDSDFVGGKGFVGWDGIFLGRKSNLDFSVGYFDMDADYNFVGGTIAGTGTDSISKNSTTVEALFTTRQQMGGWQVGFTTGVMYISDMPTIEHDVAGIASLNTDDAVTIRAMVEIVL